MKCYKPLRFFFTLRQRRVFIVGGSYGVCICHPHTHCTILQVCSCSRPRLENDQMKRFKPLRRGASSSRCVSRRVCVVYHAAATSRACCASPTAPREARARWCRRWPSGTNWCAPSPASPRSSPSRSRWTAKGRFRRVRDPRTTCPSFTDMEQKEVAQWRRRRRRRRLGPQRLLCN